MTRRRLLERIKGIFEFPFASNFTESFRFFIWPQTWKEQGFLNIQSQVLNLLISTHYHEEYKGVGIFKNTFFHYLSLHITRPEVAEAVFRSNNVLKPFLYSFSHDFIGRGLVTSNGSKWKTRRKLLTPAFYFKTLQDFLPIITDQTVVLKSVLNDKIVNHNGLIEDLLDVIQRCTLDIICESAMGTKIKAQLKQNIQYVDALQTVVFLITKRVFKPHHYFAFWYKRSQDGRRFYDKLSIIEQMTNEVIKQRKQEVLFNNNNKRRVAAFLDSLLELHFKSPEEFTEADIREEVNTFMFAGHDTTAIALTMTLWLVGKHPEVQEKIQDEIDQVFTDDQKVITMDKLRRLKYLEAVFKESLRLYPPVSFLGRRLTKDACYGQDTIKLIPKDIDTYTFPYVVHRCPDHWPNPDSFDPNRFLDVDVVKKRHPFAYIPFAAGGRNCLGQKFAQLEEKAVLASLFRNFSFESLDQDLTVTPNLTLHTDKHIRVIFKRRKKIN